MASTKFEVSMEIFKFQGEPDVSVTLTGKSPVELLERIHQIVTALFRHHPAKIEDVGVLLEAVLLPDDVRGSGAAGLTPLGI